MKLFIFFIFLIGANYSYYSIAENCTKDEECTKYNKCLKNKCHHIEYITFDTPQVIGFISIIFGSALSNSGGIGGGGLYVPILIMILNFYTHEAIPISKIMTFAGSLTSFIFNLHLKHPSRETMGIDYNICKLIIPSLLFGTVIGIILNKMTTSFIILFTMTIVLFYNTYKTFKRVALEYSLENEIKLIISPRDNRNTVQENPPTGDQRLIVLEIDKDKVKFPFHNFVYFFICYVSILLITLLRGSDHFKSIANIEYCSLTYWMIFVLYLPVVFVLTLYAMRDVKREYIYRLSIGFPYDKNDISYNTSNNIKFPFIGLFIGTLSGLLGIGGGLFLCPILLIMGVNPITATCTSNFLMLFTSSSTSIQFFLHGMLNIPYSLVCATFSVIGSFLGTLVIQYILITTQRSSMRILPLAIVILICSIMLPTISFYDFVKNPSALFDFNSPC